MGWDFNTVWQLQEGEKYPVLKTANVSGNPSLPEERSIWHIKTLQKGLYMLVNEPRVIYIHDLTGRTVFSDIVQRDTWISLQQGVYIVSTRAAGKTYTAKVLITS